MKVNALAISFSAVFLMSISGCATGRTFVRSPASTGVFPENPSIKDFQTLFNRPDTVVPTVNSLKIGKNWTCHVYSFPNGILDTSAGPTGAELDSSNQMSLLDGGQIKVHYLDRSTYDGDIFVFTPSALTNIARDFNSKRSFVISIRMAADGRLIVSASSAPVDQPSFLRQDRGFAGLSKRLVSVS
jgi:hypothetical protein